MKKFRSALLLSIVALFTTSLTGYAQDEKANKISRTGGNLESNLYLLNMWGEQSEDVNELYKAVYNALLDSPDATYFDVSENTEVQEIFRKNGKVHFGGPMLGNISESGASVWIRTLNPAKVEVELNVDGEKKSFGPVKSTAGSDMTSIVWIDGLKPGTEYPYRVLVDGKPIDIPDNATINTLPGKVELPDFRIAFGTCFHRWGLGNMKQSEAILSRKPMAMLLGGDIGVQDRLNNTAMHRADYFLRDLFPAWQKLVAAMPVYATWDDHDYFDNDLARDTRRIYKGR